MGRSGDVPKRIAALVATTAALVPFALAVTFMVVTHASAPDDPNPGGGMLVLASLPAGYLLRRWIYQRLVDRS